MIFLGLRYRILLGRPRKSHFPVRILGKSMQSLEILWFRYRLPASEAAVAHSQLLSEPSW